MAKSNEGKFKKSMMMSWKGGAQQVKVAKVIADANAPGNTRSTKKAIGKRGK